MKVFIFMLCISAVISAQDEGYHEFRGRSYLRVGGTYYNLQESGERGDKILTHQLIVKTRGNFPLTQAFLNQNGFPMFQLEPQTLFDGHRLLRIKELKPRQMDAFEHAQNLSRLGMFTFMEFDAEAHFNAAPCPSNDTLFVSGDQSALETINVPQAWCITTGIPNVTIAVLDQGFDVTHPDLINNIWVNPLEDVNGNGRPDYTAVALGGDIDNIDNDGNGKIDDLAGWNFQGGNNDLSLGAHGTQVAGVIAAQRNNGMGVAGIAGGNNTTPGCSVMLLKVNSASDTALAMSYAADHGARVINLSSGYDNLQSIWWLETGIEHTVYNRGIPFVAAAGNYCCAGLDYPARFEATIAVSTIDEDMEYDGDAYGPEVDLVAQAPIGTTSDYGGYNPNFRRTSSTTPQISAVIGLMLSVNPNLSSGSIRRILEDTTIKLPDMNGANWHPMFGYGAVNAYEAVLQALWY